MDLLPALAKVAGVTGLVIGVLYLLYRQILGLGIFERLSSTQTFLLVGMLAILVWLLAMAALFRLDPGARSVLLVGSNNNIVQQGAEGSP